MLQDLCLCHRVDFYRVDHKDGLVVSIYCKINKVKYNYSLGQKYIMSASVTINKLSVI